MKSLVFLAFLVLVGPHGAAAGVNNFVELVDCKRKVLEYIEAFTEMTMVSRDVI